MVKVVVVGSCMIDLTCFSPRLPKCGETIFGTSFKRDFGGKGANQCIAATRLGAETALIACLGDDLFGKEYVAHLQSNGVNTNHVSLIKNESCGIAQISVADNGDNHIVIVPGANSHLAEKHVLEASKLLCEASVVVFQFETPLQTTLQALKLCKQQNPVGTTIVNCAPAMALTDNEIFQYTDILCVNESEAHLMTGFPTSTRAECEKALRQLLFLGAGIVIITLGKEGAIFASSEDTEVQHEPGTPVESPVDTTGAGDMFLGSLAFLLAYRSHWPMKWKIQMSCRLAAHSITKRGTQSSFPNSTDLPPTFLNN